MARFIVIAAASGIGQATVKLLKAAAAQPSHPTVAPRRKACPVGSGQRCGTR
jgi:NADPH:quinone reductase-like Zn-dependent oxidoreductase